MITSGKEAAMRGKKPTREQKIFLKSKGLNPANWLVISDDQYRTIVMHRHSLKPKTIVREES
jgi:hypothetical protein